MKKFIFRGVFDGFRLTTMHNTKTDLEFQENLKAYQFFIKRTFHHGFPFQPSAMAYDPVQNLLAIGTQNGTVRILGQPGVDSYVRHDPPDDDTETDKLSVTHLCFSSNFGHLISVTSNGIVHLWNYRQKPPQILHNLQFQKETITYIFLPVNSKWFFVGTNKGNVYTINIDSFVLSNYVINWNKTIAVSRKTHPGKIIHISETPVDNTKLLIGFESGHVALWDLRNKTTEFRYQTQNLICSISWHHDGKQFFCSQIDGIVTCWSLKQTDSPVHTFQPYGKSGSKDDCKPITKIKWTISKSNEPLIFFIGGVLAEQSSKLNTLSVMSSNGTILLEMDESVIDFIILTENPLNNESKPQVLIALTQNNLILFDMEKEGFPLIENPYPMDIHESPVTYIFYLAACPEDLIPLLYSVGRGMCSSKKSVFSDRSWPITGGQWEIQPSGYSEIIITGHMDGSVKFWDASAGTLQILYKLKTAKLFEKTMLSETSASQCADESSVAVQYISFCTETKKLCVANSSGFVTIFKFKKTETVSNTHVIEVPISIDHEYDLGGGGGSGSGGDDETDLKKTSVTELGMQRKPVGFQLRIICVPISVRSSVIPAITSMEISSSFGLVAYGHENGLVIVDIVQKSCIFSMRTSDIYFPPGMSPPHTKNLKKSSQSDVSEQIEEAVYFNQHLEHMNESPKKCGGSSASGVGGGGSAGGSGGGGGSSISGGCGGLNIIGSSSSLQKRSKPDPLKRPRSQDKLDNSFSRSRSSSTNSLESNPMEAIVSLHFSHSYILKSEPCALIPTLWIGTNTGTVLTIIIALPSVENREKQPVNVTCTGASMFRLKGSILSIIVVDFVDIKVSAVSDDAAKKSSSSSSPTSQTDSSDKQFVIVTSEKQIRLYTLPSFYCAFRYELKENYVVFVKSQMMFMTDGPCMACYLSNGHVIVFTLPSLTILVDVEFLPLEELRFQTISDHLVDPLTSRWGQKMFCRDDITKISKVFCFTNRGHGLYLSSPFEIQKFTISSEFFLSISESVSDLWISNEKPDLPKESFLKGIFNTGLKSNERDILFGESFGKGGNVIAKLLPITTVDMQQRTSSATSEISRAHNLVVERGEKLSQLEDRSERMATEAEILAQTTQALALKYKNRKWYHI